ncbi:AAA family ATPase [Alkanindiges illinoisensis]|uniref:AAA family ATPase n=1 Tax=Alkanindiges illinoisensis TaxID=197183 RepID=UPI00047B99F4|nr:AAA family ATPase [Alkanindiges illinoisensis]
MLNGHENDTVLHQPNDGRIKLNIARLKEKRKHLGLSQEALALHSFELKIYLSVASIKRAEAGKAVLYRTAKQFARLYDIAVEELIHETVNVLEGITRPEAMAASLAAQSLLANDSRNIICLTIQFSAGSSPEIRATLQQRFTAPNLSCHVVEDGHTLHLLFGSQQASQHDLFDSLRYAWAVRGSLTALDQRSRLLLHSAQWHPANNSLRFWGIGFRGVDFQGLTLASLYAAAKLPQAESGPELWVAHGLHAELQHHAYFDDTDLISPDVENKNSRYLRLLDLTDHCRHCPVFQHLDISSTCNQCHQRIDQLSLYGRERELLLMQMAMQEVLQDQLTTVLYIRGVAGVGKSRLIEEFVGIAQQHQLRCYQAWLSDSQHEFQESLLAQLVLNTLEVPLLHRHQAECINELLAPLHLSELQRIALLLLMKVPLASENPLYTALSTPARETLRLEAVASVLMQLSLKQPLLLVIEDVHWADQLDLAALGQLLIQTQDAPIIWLLSSRHEQDPLEQSLRQSIVDLSFTLLDLSPLRPADALQLAAQFPDVDPVYRERCIQHANGNPLFLTQLLRARQMDHLPATLAHLIQGKLDYVSALDRRVLRYASVAGRQVSVSQILAVLNIEAYSFEALVKHYLMRALGEDYVFVHNLIAMSIYEAMDDAQRLNLHLDWAQYYQQRDAASSAFHFQKANDPRAVMQYLLAIQAYYDRLDYPEAHQLIEQCLSIEPLHFDDETRYRVHYLAASIANKLGQTHQARHYYEQAMHLAPSAKKKLTAAIGLIRTLNILEARQAELALLEQVMPEALAQQDTEVLAQLFNIKANLSFFLGNISDCKTFHNQAIHYAEMTNLQEIRVRSYGGLGDASYAQGHMQTAREYLERSIVLARKHQLLEIETANLFMLATLRIYANETRAALQDAVTAAELSKRVGNRRAEVVSRLTAGWIFISLCQYEQAQIQVNQGLELARAMGAFRFEAFLLESLARLAWVNGQPQDARTYITQAWQLIEQHQCHAFIGPWILATKALLTEDNAMNNAVVQQDLQIAQPILDKGCVGHNYYRFYVAVAEYYLMRNNPVEARNYAGKLRDYTADQPCPWSLHFIELIELHANWLEAPNDLFQQHAWRRCFSNSMQLGLAGVTPHLLQVYQQQTQTP